MDWYLMCFSFKSCLFYLMCQCIRCANSVDKAGNAQDVGEHPVRQIYLLDTHSPKVHTQEVSRVEPGICLPIPSCGIRYIESAIYPDIGDTSYYVV